jgi:hypothetical protein
MNIQTNVVGGVGVGGEGGGNEGRGTTGVFRPLHTIQESPLPPPYQQTIPKIPHVIQQMF